MITSTIMNSTTVIKNKKLVKTCNQQTDGHLQWSRQRPLRDDTLLPFIKSSGMQEGTSSKKKLRLYDRG